VRYQKASAPEAALLLGQPSLLREPRLVEVLDRSYPGAAFLVYSEASGAWVHVPEGNRRTPTFMGFRGPLPSEDFLVPRPCVAFQGSTQGPGRIFYAAEFNRESIPVPGPLSVAYGSPAETVYVVTAGGAPVPR
jgi:hypothetical protein